MGTEGGGGGKSSIHPIPYYQVGTISAASLGSKTHRNVPDVALNADPDTGYAVIINGMFLIIDNAQRVFGNTADNILKKILSTYKTIQVVVINTAEHLVQHLFGQHSLLWLIKPERQRVCQFLALPIRLYMH